MIFADDQQLDDYRAAVMRLRKVAFDLPHASTHQMTVAELGERIAELRDIEATLLCIYRDREEAEKHG